MSRKRYICSCYFTNNIFLKRFNLHVNYDNEDRFWKLYGEILKKAGNNDVRYHEYAKKEIEEEISRRKSNGMQSKWRKDLICSTYDPLYKEVYSLKDSYLHPDFLNIVKYAKQPLADTNGLLQLISCCQGERVYSLPVFTPHFCQMFLEELKHFEKSELPKGRPNSMNISGILLEEVGFYPEFFDKLRVDYLSPIASLLYPEWIGDSGLDSQRAFIVRYNFEEDGDNTDLNLHFDNAEVTLNVSLNGHFEGGDLFFGGMRQAPSSSFTQVLHRSSYGIFHRGQHLHGAMPIEFGERYNLIIWMRSSSIRNNLCPMCDQLPSLVETEGDGDGFTVEENVVDICSLT